MSGDTGQDALQVRRAAADRMRRRILSDEYVERATADGSPAAQAFQEYILDAPWQLWTRPGLSPRDRSIATLAMTAAMGREEEFALHCRSAGRAGVTDEELDELILQIAAYCGAPAGVAARRILGSTRREATSHADGD